MPDNSSYIDIFKYSIGSIVAAGIGLWAGMKGKRRDIDNQKIKELNVILANMLLVWHYLDRLSDLLSLSEDDSHELIFPKAYIPLILLKSGTLNDRCFQELESSIDNLKQYAPIDYYKLEGVGKRFDYIRQNYLIPFLQSYKTTDTIKRFSRHFLDKLLEDIQEYSKDTAKLISRKVRYRVNKIFESNNVEEFEKWKEELNQGFYALFIRISGIDISYDELKREFKNSEMQKDFLNQIELLAKVEIGKLMELISENPSISIEEIQSKFA